MRKSLLILIGVGALLLLLLAAFILNGPFRRQAAEPRETTSTPAASVDREPSQVAFTPVPQASMPTESGAQSSTATVGVRPEATTIPSTPSVLTPLLYDDFSQITSGWTPLFVSQEQTVNGYSAESFAFSTASPGKLLYNVLPTLSFAPTRYGIDLQPIEGTGMFGLLFEVSGDQADYSSLSFYGVGLTTDGDVMLLIKGIGPELQVLSAAKGAIPPLSLDKVVRLVIERHENSLTILVDGTEVLTTPAAAPKVGTVGFFARADDRLAIHFDNLLLTTGAQGTQQPCAQLRLLGTGASSNEALRGEDVAIVERRLAHLGYTTDRMGIYNAQTMSAVTEFQRRNGLSGNGRMDSQTWCRLLSSEAVLADSDHTELAMLRERYRPVAISLDAELPVPLLVSVRGANRQWQIALALPKRISLHYIDTGGDALDSVWQPDQRLLAFTSVRAGNDQNTIWILDTTSGKVKQISPISLNSQYPSWSPDGRALMFTGVPLEGDKKARNYTYTLATGEIAAWGEENNGWSDWSPVGTVVFTRFTSRSFDIFAANPDGSDAVNLTNTDDYHEDIPAWSPSGDRIAFVRNPRSDSYDRQICIMQADGSDVQQITSLPVASSNPIWLDATMIVFSNQRSKDPNDNVRQPYLLRLPGDLRRLSASEERIWYLNRFNLKSLP